MKCDFFIHEEESLRETLDFFKSIGISWLKSNDLAGQSGLIIDIDFIYTPDVLKIYSLETMPTICKASIAGITFYLCSIPPSFLHSKDGYADGIVFSPISNIKAINTFGEIALDKENTQISMKE